MLVFCGTRERVEKAASDLASLCRAGVLHVGERSTGMTSSGSAGGSEPAPRRAAFLAELPKNMPEKLRECLEHGVGYHHARAQPALSAVWIVESCVECCM